MGDAQGTGGIVFTPSSTKRKLAHVATETHGYNEFAAQFMQRFAETYKRKNLAAMYWLRTPVPVTNPVDRDHALIVDKGTPEQIGAWRALAEGGNICILGPGGTGKSQMIRWVKQIFLESDNSVVVTASTANAAFLLGGTTLHKFAGVPVHLCDDTKYDLKQALEKYIFWTRNLARIVNGIRTVNLWICDEISLLSPRIFLLVDLAFRFYRDEPALPFGGVQFLWSGDFLQIPPVMPNKRTSNEEPQSPFLFSHEAWTSSWQPVIFPFTTNKRS
jgi:hypothetical protein